MFVGESDALALAAHQHGVIVRDQALGVKMATGQVDHRIASGRWQIVYPGVYRIVGAPLSARQRAMAACLWLGDGAAISHLTAGRLLRLDGIPRKTPLHVSVPLDARRASLKPRPFVLHRVTRFDDVDRTVVDNVPCTSAVRTLIDLAAVVTDETLEIAFESARRLGLVTVDQFALRFAQVAGRGKKGSAKVRRLLEQQALGARALESPLEVKLWRLLRRSSIPMPQRQVGLRSHAGTAYRVDFVWNDVSLIVECDGFEAHSGHLRWKRDRTRVAEIELLGYRVVHVTWDDVTKRPHETVQRIEIARATRPLSTQPAIPGQIDKVRG